MSKSESFIRHTVVYGVGALSLRLVGVALLPLHTRYIDPTDFGLLHLLLRVGEILNILLMLQGIGLATLNFFKLPDDENEPKHIAASATVFLSIVIVVGAILAVGFARPIAEYLGVSGRESLLICGLLCILAEATIIMPLTLLQARLESTVYIATTTAVGVLRCLLTAMLVVWLRLGLWGVLLALGLSYASVGIVLSIREMRRSSFVPKRSQIAAIGKFALPFLPTGICFFVIQSGDQFLLMKYCGIEQVGFYGFGNQIGQMVSFFVMVPIFRVWQTWRYKAYKDNRKAELFGAALTRIAFVYCFFALALLCFRDEAVLLLGSKAFDVAKYVVAPLVFAHFFMGMASLFDAPFHILKRTDLKPWISLVSTIVILLLYIALIPSFGNVGAAYATAVGMLFHACATFVVAQRVMFVRMQWDRLGWLALSMMPCVCALVNLASMPNWLPVRIGIVAAWMIGVWYSSMVADDEKALLLGLCGQLSSRLRLVRN